MRFGEFRKLLGAGSTQVLEIRLPRGSLAPHFHITEVGKVTKDFVDCGGQRRTDAACVLQTLVANDTDHRLSASKLGLILSKSIALGLDDDLPIDIEVQGQSIELWQLTSMEILPERIVLHAESKRTACLAPDKCRLEVLPMATGGCCDGQSQ